MEYVSPGAAKSMTGLRLVLSAGVPGPWGEAAKNLFELRGVAYTPVAQKVMEANEELAEWTGLRNAPIAVYENEAPLDRWLDILMLAERLGRGPSLLPDESIERALCVGIASEIAGEWGLGWCCRVHLFTRTKERMETVPIWPRIRRDYGITEAAAEAVPGRIRDILAMLANQLERQQGIGFNYLVGKDLSAADIYWSTFSQILAPMEPERCPMPDYLRRLYGKTAADFREAVAPSLVEHRDFIYREHLKLPVDF
jgi:glutathione S-transferase